MNVADLKWIQGKRLDLFIESFSDSVGNVQIRGISGEEQIIFNHKTNATRALKSEVFRITNIPLFLTARETAPGVKRGELYVRVSLQVDGVDAALLFAGYITDTSTPIYPNGKVESSISGPGFMRSITGTNPAVGAEISETVPAGARWKLHALRFELVTDGNAANRGVLLDLGNGADTYHATRQHDIQILSLTRQYNYSLQTYFLAAVNFSEFHNILPDIIMPAGHVLKTVTGSIQAGDNYGAPQLLVEEWIEP